MKKIFFIILFISISAFAQINTEQQSMLNYATISVTIGGKFPITGSFPALMTERVDQFVTRVYSEAFDKIVRTTNDLELLKETKKELTDYSLRGIKLIRASGEELMLDLAKFRLDGDFINNPYLKNDDVIIFPPIDRKRNFFSVTGAVNQPGIFDFVDGDKLSDAIFLSSGINEAYDVKEIRVHRLNYDGSEINKITLSLNDDIELERGDQIQVFADETQRKRFNVMIIGEVNSPGTYPIKKQGSKIGELIEMAGGLNSSASLKHSRLFRGGKLTQFLELAYGIKLDNIVDYLDPEVTQRVVNFEDLMMYRMSNLVVEDTAYFQIENQLRVLTEGSSIDFAKISDPNSDIYNFELKDGDIILIPQIKKAVYVFGQVPNPGYINYKEGNDYQYYISEAGGLGEYAEDDIMVIKGASRNWIPVEEVENIEDGDYIFVPKERLRSFRSIIGEYAGYLGILGSIATITLLVVQLGK